VGATDAKSFVTAARDVACRARRLNIRINDIEVFDAMTDAEVADAGATASCGPFVFLGEVMLYGPSRPEPLFANAPRHVENLAAAWHRFRTYIQRPAAIDSMGFGPPPWETDIVTLRHFAALIGLATWMAHTLNIQMCRLAHLVRTSSALAIAAADGGWDSPVRFVSPATMVALETVIASLLKNEPVPVADYAAPTSDYDVVINTDASAYGWAAIVHQRNGPSFEVREGWSVPVLASASSEPLAAAKAVAWARARFGARCSVAVVTDHEPMVTAQRCWWSGFGGFSSAHNLNMFYLTLYNGS
jgi:hypothetical protein